MFTQIFVASHSISRLFSLSYSPPPLSPRPLSAPHPTSAMNAQSRGCQAECQRGHFRLARAPTRSSQKPQMATVGPGGSVVARAGEKKVKCRNRTCSTSQCRDGCGDALAERVYDRFCHGKRICKKAYRRCVGSGRATAMALCAACSGIANNRQHTLARVLSRFLYHLEHRAMAEANVPDDYCSDSEFEFEPEGSAKQSTNDDSDDKTPVH